LAAHRIGERLRYASAYGTQETVHLSRRIVGLLG
jgi:hypothetical protein